jgi:hypothetical protein
MTMKRKSYYGLAAALASPLFLIGSCKNRGGSHAKDSLTPQAFGGEDIEWICEGTSGNSAQLDSAIAILLKTGSLNQCIPGTIFQAYAINNASSTKVRFCCAKGE